MKGDDMRFTTRELVTLAVFGSLWGAVEMSVGALLHAVHAPLTGAWLAAAGVAVALVGRVFVPRRGATLFIGIVALCLKLFSVGSVVLGPVIGILAEAALAEAVLSLALAPRRALLVAAGAFAVLWTLVQPVVTGLLIFGRDGATLWLDLLSTGQRLFGLSPSAGLAVVLTLTGLHLALGGLAGWIAWDAARLLKARLQPAELAAA
jgi:hypothetical protein